MAQTNGMAQDLEKALLAIARTQERKQEPTVTLESLGYQWICPKCHTLNVETDAEPNVTCYSCRNSFEAQKPAENFL